MQPVNGMPSLAALGLYCTHSEAKAIHRLKACCWPVEQVQNRFR